MVVATRADPAALAEYVFGHDYWDIPKSIIRDVFQPHARVAVKACHASSKTFTAADAVLVALLMGGDVITTAPTWTQVEQVLWGAVHRALSGGRIPLSEWGTINRTELRLATGEFAIGLSTDQAVRFQGYHARAHSFLLIVMDEAPGVLPSIYEAVAGISAGGDVRQLLLGNPVIASGPFFDIFANESPSWERYTIDAFDTPNLRGVSLEQLLAMTPTELDDNERAYLIDRRWVYNAYHEWGEDHPLWESRVRGRFPLQGEDALLSLAWLEQASNRSVTYDEAQPVQAGVDVAGPGEDETVCCVRQGHTILGCQAWTHADARGDVLAMLREFRARGPVETVNVDTAGIGHYFAQGLKDEGYTVREVNVGERPTTDAQAEKYSNLKAELYWAFRGRCADGDLAGLTDRKAIAQLAGIRYSHDPRGRVKIESKDDARKRGVKSPDRAEAMVLAFAPADPHDILASAVRTAMAPRAEPEQSERKLPDRAYEDRRSPRRVERRGGWR